jgi:hypothetical protein
MNIEIVTLNGYQILVQEQKEDAMDIERFKCDEQQSRGRNAVEDAEDLDSGMKSIRKTV